MKVVSNVALRNMRQGERRQAMADAAPPHIAVVPNEKYRAILKHPHAGGFGTAGGKLWPNDRFTRRRLLDGSISLHETHEKAKHHHRERSE